MTDSEKRIQEMLIEREKTHIACVLHGIAIAAGVGVLFLIAIVKTVYAHSGEVYAPPAANVKGWSCITEYTYEYPTGYRPSRQIKDIRTNCTTETTE